MSLNQSFISDFSEYYRAVKRSNTSLKDLSKVLEDHGRLNQSISFSEYYR